MGRRTTPDLPSLWRFSAALTSRERLLPVVAAIAPGAVVNATAIDAVARLGVTRVYHELRCLEDAGLLRAVPSERATADFEITDPEAWSALRSLVVAATEGRVGPN